VKDIGYMTIPPGALIPGILPEFRIYILSKKGKYVLWALEGNKVSPEQLARLSESGIKEVFVDLKEKFKYEQYLETNLGSILENQWSPDDQKASIFSKVSTNVVRNAFETSLGMGSMDSSAIQRTETMVKNALVFIRESKSIPALAKMIGHDYQTYEHATKVLWFTVAFLRDNPDIAERIQPDYRAFNEQQKTEILEQCGVGALLHDIGKAFVAQDILNKNGPLTEVEWEIMRRHPLNGLAMLLDSELPLFVKKAILHHHEDFHGKGYPMGLEGPSISMLARVLRIIDTFDAMTSRRPYKAPLSPGKTAKIMIGTPDAGGADGSEPDDRDQGMKQCFDEELLRKFILFLGNVKLT
jgi:HD-GYP domain-containing protein (c-di-GMP phosphodiesterase class II)